MRTPSVITQKGIAHQLSAQPSKFVEKWAAIPKSRPLPALDAGGGFGRNTLLLSRLGYTVLCADRAEARLGAFKESRVGRELVRERVIKLVCADLDGSHLPFEEGTFYLVVLVHFVPRHLEYIARTVAPGGMLIVETFGGQGGNWIQLPRANAYRRALQSRFDFKFYRERKVGPPDRDAVSVRLVALRRDFSPNS